MDFYKVENLPADTGGVHKPYVADATDAPYGFYVYTPSYHDNLEKAVFPLLIFLHGKGEIGNSSNGNTDVLDKVLIHGPPKLIETNKWEPPHPMIVVSPQSPEGSWKPSKVKELIEYIISEYKVNVRRIYITGLSMGGFGTFKYVGEYGDASMCSAIVPICGAGSRNQAESFENIPVWAFHGDADNTVRVNGSLDMVEVINERHPKYPAKVTIYPGVGHNSWTKTYDGTGMGTESTEYSAFNQSIYEWLLQYERTDLDSLIN